MGQKTPAKEKKAVPVVRVPSDSQKPLDVRATTCCLSYTKLKSL
jgi:hypothetical protein